MSGSSLISKSLAVLRERGYAADVCERSNRFVKHDLHGFGDIHAFSDDLVMIVQVTDSDHAAGHRLKLLLNPLLCSWAFRSDRRAILHVWSRRKLVHGGRRWVWRLTEELYSASSPPKWLVVGEDLEEVGS